MNRTYGFEDEAVKKHGDQTYKVFPSASSADYSILNCAFMKAFRRFVYHLTFVNTNQRNKTTTQEGEIRYSI